MANKTDLTFSSSSEVQSFVRARMGMPGTEGQGTLLDGIQIYSDGKVYDPIQTLNSGGIQIDTNKLHFFLLTKCKGLVFRTVLNPVDYDGSMIREIKNGYKTNELGFFITLSFFMAMSWSFFVYRKNTILETRKRLIF